MECAVYPLDHCGEKEQWRGSINRLMTKSEKKKAQASKGEKGTIEAGPIDEYDFFVTGSDSGQVKGETKNSEASKKDIIDSKESIKFFLPE